MSRRRRGVRKVEMKDGEVVSPTEQQAENAVYELHDIVDRSAARNIVIGKAFRRRPMVDILAQQGLFSTAEYKALRAYRHFASVADRSPLRDSLNRQRGHGSGDIGAELATAIRVTTDAERAAGSLRDILRAVIVHDISLSQWAMEHYGSVDKCRDYKGQKVCRPAPRQKCLEIVRLEIQMAAKRVESEIAA